MSDRDRDEVDLVLLNLCGLFKGYRVSKAHGMRMAVERLDELWREATPLIAVEKPAVPANATLQ